MARFWQGALQPVLAPDFLLLTLDAAIVTLAYAVLGTLLSIMIGLVGGVAVSEIWWRAVLPRHDGLRNTLWSLLRGLLAVPRGIHELVWGLIFINILGLDPLTAILAIAIPYGAIIAKVVAETLDETDQGPYKAILNSGSRPLVAILYGLVPTALPDLISYAFYRLECGIRAAAVLGVIGAGGLGYQILLSMQTLDYSETWTFFYALLLLSGLADRWSAAIRGRLRDGSLLNHSDSREKSIAPNLGDPLLTRSLLAAGLLVPISIWYVSPNWGLVWSERTGRLVGDLATRSWPPVLLNSESLWELSTLTLAMSILSAAIATLGGGLLAFPAARIVVGEGAADRPLIKIGRRLLTGIIRSALLLMRAIPAPIWALLLLFVFFPGILPGAFALALYNMGVLGRLMSEVVENVDPRPSQAIRAAGARPPSVFLYGVLPVVTPRFTALGLYRWENAIRETAIVGVVGAGGLGRALSEQLAAFNYPAVMTILMCLILLTFGVDLISGWVRPQLR